MENLLLNAMRSSPGLLKSITQDPDVPLLYQAMAGTHKEEFVEVMHNEINKLKKHGNWTVVQKKNLLAGTNVLLSTWSLGIKRYPD
jgi:hypothetical protein